jgi:hypothetical protein
MSLLLRQPDPAQKIGKAGVGVVVHLQRDNSFVVLGWIVDDMGEVAVQGQQNGVDFLGLRNDDRVP